MVSEIFDSTQSRPVEGLVFKDITYHRALEQGTRRRCGCSMASSWHAGGRHSRGLLDVPWVPTRWVGGDSFVWGLIWGCLALVFGRNQTA
jgi:hypothetical protein